MRKNSPHLADYLERPYWSTVISVVSVALVAIITGIVMPTDAWGALGQWMGAVGTVLAVTVALRIALREATAEAARDRAERVQQEAERAEREIEQARLVTAEMIYPTAEELFHVPHAPDAVRITNHSSKHIFHPRVEGFVHQNSGTTTWDIADPMDAYSAAPTVLRAGERDTVPVEVTYNPPVTEKMYPMRTQPVIGFVDADGRRWRRTGSATPVQVSSRDGLEVGGPSWYRADPDS